MQPTDIPNADPAEIARYAALADTWWSASGPFWPLHRLNTLRVGYIRKTLCALHSRSPDVSQPLRGLHILDLGCGGGLLSEALAHAGAAVHGVDVVERNIAVARHHAEQSGVNVVYELISAEDLVARGATYDVVLNMEVVEHVPDRVVFLHTCAELVEEGGSMIVATINRTLRAFVFAIVGAEYVLRWLPRGTHQWQRFCTPEEVQEALRERGLTLHDRCGVRVNPFNRRFSLSANLDVNYMLTFTRAATETGSIGA